MHLCQGKIRRKHMRKVLKIELIIVVVVIIIAIL